MIRPLHLGFACSWWHPRETTWSHTPSGLLDALREEKGVIVSSIDAQRVLAVKAALAVGHNLLSPNAWQYGGVNRRLTTRKVRKAAKHRDLDAVLAVGETEPRLSVPTFLYQDMGFGVALENMDGSGQNAPNVLRASRRRLDQLAREQSRLYRSCAGVLTMGTWFARWLVEHEGLAEGRVRAIGGGLNALPPTRPPRSAGATRQRLLFVGRDFFRKGGDLVLDAVTTLRAGGAGPFSLTVVGPAKWPRQGAPPAWVDFRGPLAPSQISRLWGDHDIFVLPSWFEAYGLVFLEARAAGLPCVGRRAFAMPELVPDGVAGSLVGVEGGADEVAEAIHAVSTDDALFERVSQDADRVRNENSWSAVASRAVGVVSRTVRPS
ncbi:MAG: glycosyltransferase family 4 protein [Actinobacteria bacterium]|nr:glycosyltransferase family 4 protein [Actinomycetota bacterium]